MASSAEQSEAVATATNARGLSSVRASWWSVTINNPTQGDRNLLLKENFPAFVKYWKCQEEIGENGTLHIQGALNTAQIRASAVKTWLPRAHIEVAREKEALLKYVEKADTAVAGTQVVIKADYLAMDSALMAIAKARPSYNQWLDVAFMKERATDGAFEKWEFWKAVNEILKEKPKAVGLFTNPQLERAWKNTRSVWIDLLYKTDRQDILNSMAAIRDNNNLRLEYNASQSSTPSSPSAASPRDAQDEERNSIVEGDI